MGEHRLAPLTVNELLAVQHPENTIIGGDLLDVGGLMLVVGPTSVGKSYFLLQLAMSLVTGTAICGQWAVSRPFSVYLVQAEIGRRRFQQRVGKLWANFQSVAAAPLWLESPYDLKLDSADGLRAVEAEIIQREVEILIIDPLRPFHAGNENDSQEMQRLFDSFLRLQFKHNVAIVFSHHDRKPSADNFGKSIYETRGNTIITDRPDTVLRLRPTKQPTVVEAVWEKARNAAELPPKQQWTADRTTGLFTLTEKAAVPADRQAVACRLLKDGGLPLSELTVGIMQSAGISQKAAYAVIDSLQRNGTVSKQLDGTNRKVVVLI